MADAGGTEYEVADPRTIGRARVGDDDAMASLWCTYQPQVMRLLRVKRISNAEDVASQVWLEVGRTMDRFAGDGDDFRRWIFTIARRRAIDDIRRTQRRAEVPAESLARELPTPDGADGVDARDSLDAALEAISQLTPAAAEAVTLRVVYDLPVAEVAAITGRTEGNVRILVHRGLNRLRSILEHPDSAPVTA